jgi:deoxyribodipyrimidine photolyase-like uncharacterized protein
MITGILRFWLEYPDEIDAWYLGIYIDAIEWVRDYQYTRNEPIC